MELNRFLSFLDWTLAIHTRTRRDFWEFAEAREGEGGREHLPRDFDSVRPILIAALIFD